MRILVTISAGVLVVLLFTACPQDEAQIYDPKKDPEIGFINNHLVPRSCSRLQIDTSPQTHRVFTLPSLSFMSVKVDLGKMDLDPTQIEPVTESLIALSWGRADLCMNIKQRASGSSEQAYQKAWDAYMANTEKLSQFALIALKYKPDAVTTGKAKTATTSPAPSVSPANKQAATKNVVNAIQKWLDSYGATKATAPTSPVEAEPAAPESKRHRLLRLSRELTQVPVKHDSEVGL